MFSTIFILLVFCLPAFGQFEQMRRARERMGESVRAEDEKERRRNAADPESVLPRPKAARMNVDVQSVLSAREYKTFGEAKLHPLTSVADGEPLWLYLKFSGKLGDYVLTTRDIDDPSRLRYSLFTEIGPKGDITALSQYKLQFTKDDLTANEFKIALSPAVAGRNRSTPAFLGIARAARPGQWTNEIRVSNLPAYPRGLGDHLASAPVILDLRSGNAKYQKMAADYDSIMLRGSTDLAIVPPAGTFFDLAVKNLLSVQLNAAGIKPAAVYFTGDEWWESMGSPASMSPPSRRSFAVYTYRKGENCLYGIAEATEVFNNSTAKYGEPSIKLTSDIPTPCIK